MTDKVVTKCWACPFSVLDSHENDPRCHAPGIAAAASGILVDEPDDPPEWCPLPVTIRFQR